VFANLYPAIKTAVEAISIHQLHRGCQSGGFSQGGQNQKLENLLNKENAGSAPDRISQTLWRVAL
jgi:hypothetical protein